jgi:tight adherence protein B
MRDRVKLHGKINTLSAEGKFSGYLLSAFPFILALVFYLINPEYMSILWTTAAGRSMCVIGLILMSLGYVWLMRIVKIKV